MSKLIDPAMPDGPPADEPRWNARYQAYYEEGRESGLDETEAGRYADRRATEELGSDPTAGRP